MKSGLLIYGQSKLQKFKIPKLMRDMGQGVNAFKKGLKEEDKDKAKSKADAEPKKSIETEPEETTSARVEETEKDAAASG